MCCDATALCFEWSPVESSVYKGKCLILMCCEVADDDLCVSRLVACGAELLHAEWLVLMCCDATHVCLEPVLMEWGMADFDAF